MSRRNGGPQAAGAYKALPLGSILARMAQRLPAEPKKLPKKEDGRVKNPHNLTAEQIASLQVARKLKWGELRALAKLYGISYFYAYNVRQHWKVRA
jgi:hypothetical protein